MLTRVTTFLRPAGQPCLALALALSRRMVATESADRQLYPGHVPLTRFQRTLLVGGAALGAIITPTNGERLAMLGDATGHLVLSKLRDMMASHPVGQQILRERPFLSEHHVDVPRLRGLPDGIFGREFVRFLDTCQVSPDTRTPVRFVDDEELAYVLLRYRHIHDYVHTLLGLDISVEAELAAKWFEMMQTGLPVTALASVFGPLRLSKEELMHLSTVWIPWAIKCGRESVFLMNVYFEKHLEEPLDELRERLRITPAPLSS